MEETKLEEVNSRIIYQSGLEEDYSKEYGTTSGFGIIWQSNNVVINIIEKEPNWIICEASITKCNLKFIMFNIWPR